MARLANRSGDVSRLAFSPDGAHLASASRDWPILVWTLAGQRVELALNGHTAGVNSLAYSTDGKTLISGSDDSTVRLWDAANGQAIARVTGHTGPVLSAALSAGWQIRGVGRSRSSDSLMERRTQANRGHVDGSRPPGRRARLLSGRPLPRLGGRTLRGAE